MVCIHAHNIRFKAYLITLVNYQELVARVARRFMPKLKVESEVATMKYLREKTNVPVPTVYHYDSNPYNRLGGEFILMSKACVFLCRSIGSWTRSGAGAHVLCCPLNVM